MSTSGGSSNGLKAGAASAGSVARGETGLDGAALARGGAAWKQVLS